MSELQSGAKSAPAPAPASSSAANRPDTAAMTDRQLARAVLDKAIKPRAAELRRLAEAVLSGGKSKKAKKPKGDKADRKLPKIPGQKKKKKG
jgi:hypothetical protein